MARVSNYATQQDASNKKYNVELEPKLSFIHINNLLLMRNLCCEYDLMDFIVDIRLLE
jgi:hypothetical protein